MSTDNEKERKEGKWAVYRKENGQNAPLTPTSHVSV